VARDPHTPTSNLRGPGNGLLTILDAKRGDVGTTNDAYAEAYLGQDALLAADALTVHPYLAGVSWLSRDVVLFPQFSEGVASGPLYYPSHRVGA
jgi:hypothetical protein